MNALRENERTVVGGVAVKASTWYGKDTRTCDVGWYTNDLDNPVGPPAPSGVDCPYCKQELRLRPPDGINRVVKMIERGQRPPLLLVQPVPSTHNVLTCKGCEGVFTTIAEATA